MQIIHKIEFFGGTVAHIFDQHHVLVQLQVQYLLEVKIAVGHGVDFEAYFHAEDIPVPLVHAFVGQEDCERDVLGELCDVIAQFSDLIGQLFGFGFAFEDLLGPSEYFRVLLHFGFDFVAIELAPIAQ